MPTIMVEFVPDYSKIKSGAEQLANDPAIAKEFKTLFSAAEKELDDFVSEFSKLGEPIAKQLNPAIAQAKKSLSDLSKSGIKDFGEMKKRVDGLVTSFVDGFGEGVEQALKETGVSLQFLKKQMEGFDKPKQELKAVTDELSRMKANGDSTSEAYVKLRARAGELRDAIGDVNEEIRRQASDTGKLDVAIRVVTNLTAAYSVLQGVSALAGKDNEDLQKALLRVNAAMSILQGLQTIQNELKRTDNILTTAQIGLQKLYTTVIGTSTGALKAFRIALAATGIGLLVVGVIALVNALGKKNKKLKEAEDAVESYRASIERLNNELAQSRTTIQLLGDLELARAKALGKSEKEINDIIKRNRELDYQQVVQTEKDKLALYTKAKDERIKLEDDFNKELSRASRGNVAAAANAKNLEKQIELQKKAEAELSASLEQTRAERSNLSIKIQTDEYNELAALREKANKATNAAEKKNLEALIKERQEQELAALNLRLRDIEAGSEDELKLRKEIAIKQSDFRIENEKLTGDKLFLAYGELIDELSQLDDEYRKRLFEIKKAQIEDEKKLKEEQLKINRDALQQQLSDAEAVYYQQRKLNESIISDPASSAEAKRAALEANYNEVTKALQKEFDLNEKLLSDKLISQEDYNRSLLDLENRAFDARVEFEREYTRVVDEESTKREQRLEQVIQLAQLISTTIQGISDIMSANDEQRIAARRQELELMKQGNTLSQKEYEERMKQVDRLEARNKRKQAEREKALALFNAIINGAQSIAQAAGNAFQLPIAIATVAAQIALIAAKPIPKFGKGTKSAPKGIAEVGETGTELVQTKGGGYYLADYPQLVWFKGGEKVFNPRETAAMIPTPHMDLMGLNGLKTGNGASIDIDKLAAKLGNEIAKHPRNSISLDENGFSVYLINKGSRSRYLNSRYKFNG